MASRTSTGTPTVNPFLFNAQQFDQASGDYYLRARYYDQSNGRFISQDPFGGNGEDPITLHRYLYAGNEPVDFIDPGGREISLGAQIAVGAIVGGLAAGLADYAVTGKVRARSVIAGVAIGALAPVILAGVGVYAAALPVVSAYPGLVTSGLSVAFGGYGIYKSLDLLSEVANDPAKTSGQKAAVWTLLAASIFGTSLGVVSVSDSVAASGNPALPELIFDYNRYPELADNVWQAQRSGFPDVLTRGIPQSRAWLDAQRIPHTLSRDEYPFASTDEGGPESWVGHIPASQNSSQGGLITQFYGNNNIQLGDQFKVVVINHP